jgi:hypothetical protein
MKAYTNLHEAILTVNNITRVLKNFSPIKTLFVRKEGIRGRYLSAFGAGFKSRPPQTNSVQNQS